MVVGEFVEPAIRHLIAQIDSLSVRPFVWILLHQLGTYPMHAADSLLTFQFHLPSEDDFWNRALIPSG